MPNENCHDKLFKSSLADRKDAAMELRVLQRQFPRQTNAEQCLAQGRDEGRLEGRLQGQRDLVRRQIEVKFGALDSGALAMLASADDATLERYGEHVLTATSVDDVLGG